MENNQQYIGWYAIIFLQKIDDKYDKDLRQNILQWKRLGFFS